MDQFRHGLRNDVNDLLLTFYEDPRSLTEAISRAVRCDNRLFERRSERQLMSQPRTDQTYASVVASTPTSTTQTSHMIPSTCPSPMEINVTRHRGCLSKTKKQRCRANRLCFYCGCPGHIAITCPHRPKGQVNQVSTSEKLNSNSPVRLSIRSSPTCLGQSNSFEVLSQLDEILNE